MFCVCFFSRNWGTNETESIIFIFFEAKFPLGVRTGDLTGPNCACCKMGIELQLYRARIGCHAARASHSIKLLIPDSTRCVVTCAALMDMAILLGLLCGALSFALASSHVSVGLLTRVRAVGNTVSSVSQCKYFTRRSDTHDMAAERNLWGGTSALNISFLNCMLAEGYQWNQSSLLTLAGDIEVNPGPVEMCDLEAAMKSLRDSMSEDTGRALNAMAEKLAGEIQKLSCCMQTVTDQLAGIRNELSEVKNKLVYHEEFMEHISDRQVEIDTRLKKMEDNIERQEQRSRRDNVILYNVPEAEKETFEDSEKKFLETVNSVLPDHLDPRDIRRAHRIGKAVSGKTRPLIACMNRSADKYSILHAREDLKRKGVGVSSDRTVSQRAQLREAREAGLQVRTERNIITQDTNHRVDAAGLDVGGNGYRTRSTWRRLQQSGLS